MKTIWKAIPDYEGLYEAGTNGVIRRISTDGESNYPFKLPKILTANCTVTHPYPMISLCKGGKPVRRSVHVLIAATFLEKPKGKVEVNHKDGNKKNAKLENLEYVTRSENIKHRIRLFGIGVGVDHHNVKLTPQKVQKIRERMKQHESPSKLSKEYGVHVQCIWSIHYRRTWRHI